jgi:nicotinamide-nucleotide amidase
MLDVFPGEGVWLIGRISEKLMMRKMFLGTAESCTGGLVSVLCTNVPGSSRWFRGGIVAYDNAVKTRLLKVDAALLAANGAVSAQVVEAMARDALEVLDVHVALAVSGIAGPDGGSPDKPVGTVWIATALRAPGDQGSCEPQVVSFSRIFSGDRNDVRFGAALGALGAVDAALNSLGIL